MDMSLHKSPSRQNILHHSPLALPKLRKPNTGGCELLDQYDGRINPNSERKLTREETNSEKLDRNTPTSDIDISNLDHAKESNREGN